MRPRIERASSEGRFQQALDLAKQLHKHEPTPDHLELLKKTYLGRAGQLHTAGYDRDAATTLEAALRIDPTNSGWVQQVANELAVCGAGQKALELLRQVPGAPLGGAILARAADAAVQQEAAGKIHVPAELHAEFDRLLLAFKQVEAGQDEAAKETLQGIGLKSPFLEWKLFLRGLQAYYQNEDARALENWGRLDPQRVPARLAAPFRFHIDRAFRDAQPVATQTALQAHYDRLQGSTLAQQLRDLRAALADTECRTFAGAFRKVEALLPALRLEAPQLIPRLGACCYWAVLETGPDDVLRYKRVFGPPPDDPNFHRIEALAYEHGDYPEKAHKAWQEFEKEIAANPTVWPPAVSDRARALIYLHMGKNAAAIPEKKQLAKLPPHLRAAFDMPAPLKPGAEECFQRCSKLAPDLLEAYEELFKFHQRGERPAQSEAAARKLLERFPDHVPTLTALGQRLHRQDQYFEALELYLRALRVNPIDRKLRSLVSVSHVGCARLLLEAKRFDEARPHLESALAFNDDPDDSMIRCRWASLEFAAGHPEAAEQQLVEARAHTGSDFAVSFRMLTECARLKLDKKLKSRFDKEVKAGWTTPPTPATVVHLVRCAGSLKGSGFTYYGQKTHEKKVVAFAEKALTLAYTERQMVEVIEGLLVLLSNRAATRYAEAGERKFPKDPEFPVLHARILLRPQGKQSLPFYRITPVLARAEKLVNDLPKEDHRKERLTGEVIELKKLAQVFNPWGGGLFGGFPGGFNPFFPDDEEAFDDEGYDD